MEKVWFKLRQPDYRPEDDDSMGTSKETSPLCLGHFISDLKNLDFPLNRGEIEEFPVNMKVYQSSTLHFQWKDSQEAQTGGGLGAGAPIAAAMGLVIKASAQALFRHEVEHWEEYDQLDTYIVQPDRIYVSECLEGNKLANYIKDKKSWSMFMVTGVKVARKGKMTTSKSRHSEASGELEGDVPTVASAKGNITVARGKSEQFGGSVISDFIWAVRLAKISKGILMKDWSLAPYTKRATMDTGDEEQVDLVGTVAAEGLGSFRVIEDAELDEAFVLDDEPLPPEEERETE
ncbi:hypothetical protein PV08_07585 [Exophiala spinifera]|uniref:Uncharacterized protein n=1 Tax=Exophiala spinifera TaxID=91928 RepID=A0A0D2B7Z4_9EURO|nr:uncharacterized protein PV08_07585 [Exophiala spinifera]KIW14800.1 hypothetical protein PV08_07585 [Exophiala spinifera]